MSRFLIIFILIAGAFSSVSAQDNNADEVRFSGETLAIVNMRSGPGTGFNVLTVLRNGMPVTFIGRNQSSTWLLADADGQQGWLSYTYVSVNGDVRQLPVVQTTFSNANASPVDRILPPAPPASAPDQVVPGITQSSRQIFANGQVIGNRADVFVKVGDSITASDLFLDPIGHGGYDLFEYAYLQGVIDYFSQTSLRDHFSFANTSIAARSGWTANDVLDATNSPAGLCNTNESPLVCEYRLNRPVVALIMFGTNDIGYIDIEAYRFDLERIVQISVDMGVIPVLSTIPEQFGTYGGTRVDEFNQVIRSVAMQYDVPLWDYWLAMQPLPNLGIGSDGIHPSYNFDTSATAIFSQTGLHYGYNVRNLTALMVLDVLWRDLLD